MQDITLRKATINDLPQIQKVELLSFGCNIVDKEYDLIFNKGWGDVFIAELDGTIIGYQVVLYRGYDKDVENLLQPLIKEEEEKGKSIFHDDVIFDETKYVYFHLLGVFPDYQNTGVGKMLIKYSSLNLPDEHKDKKSKQ